MKYLIISSSRTGSSYFSQILHSFLPTSTELFSEPFHKLANTDDIFRVINKCENAVLKIHVEQLSKLTNKQVDYLLYGNWYIILLLRKNLFNCVFSAVTAIALDNHNEKKYFPVRLRIKSTHFFNIVDSKLDDWEKFAEFKQKNLYNKIVYFEDLSFNHKHDAKLVLENVKKQKRVPKIQQKTPYYKINVENKEKLQKMFYKKIQNYSHPHILNNSGTFELV